jgi:hypothetical protein
VFLLGLLPVSHILMPFWIPLAERYLALPLLGGLPLLVAAMLRQRRPWGAIALALIAVAWAGLARQHAMDWTDGKRLWEKSTRLEPHDARSWANYAAGLAAHGERAAAIPAYQRAWSEARAAGWESLKQPLYIAEALSAAGRAAEGCQLLIEEAKRLPTDRSWLLVAGAVCAQAGNDEAAHKAWATILAHDAADCEAWAGLCSLGGELMADRVYEALQHCPRDGRLWLLIADRQAAAGDAAKCIAAAQQVMGSEQAPLLRDSVLATFQRLKLRSKASPATPWD